MSDDQQLPNPEKARVEQSKILKYLLNSEHPQGGPKAKYFKSRGFSEDAWEKMRDALVTQGTTNGVVKMVDNEFGKRYTVECICPTPDTSNPCIRSVWEVKPDDGRPRLITAHPLR